MILQFNINNIRILKDLNFEVIVFSNFKSGSTVSLEKIDYLKKFLFDNKVKFFHINMYRNPFNILNIFSFFHTFSLVKKLDINIIHSQSPVGGIFGRLISSFLKLKSIYTAHGFHFYKGSSYLSWLIYYPIEKFLSLFTDDLIVMNNEDFIFATKKLFTKNIFYIPGIGIKNKQHIVNRFFENNLHSPIVIVSTGELINRKNHLASIDIVSKLEFDYIFYILGKGKLYKKINSKINKLNLNDKIKLIGYTPNVQDYLQRADLFLFTSKQEGLPVSLLEAMDEGCICIASNIRGNNDIIKNSVDGFLVDNNNLSNYIKLINLIKRNSYDLYKISQNAQEKAKKFSVEIISIEMKKIYSKYID